MLQGLISIMFMLFICLSAVVDLSATIFVGKNTCKLLGFFHLKIQVLASSCIPIKFQLCEKTTDHLLGFSVPPILILILNMQIYWFYF